MITVFIGLPPFFLVDGWTGRSVGGSDRCFRKGARICPRGCQLKIYIIVNVMDVVQKFNLYINEHKKISELVLGRY